LSTYSVTVTGWLKVEAESMDDAEKAAEQMAIGDLREYEVLDINEDIKREEE